MVVSCERLRWTYRVRCVTHWGAQPGLFRTCTTARSRVATYLDSSINTFLKKVFLRAARPNR